MGEQNKTVKDALRSEMRIRRASIGEGERAFYSEKICAELISFLSSRAPAASHIAVYLASPQEIDLTDFIRKMLKTGKSIFSPRWNGETYLLSQVVSLDERDLRCGPMGIKEPREENILDPSLIDVWVVPGLAFTAKGMRLGYGGGWYDRLLSKASSESLKVGVAHPFQIVESLPFEEHDVLLDAVLSV